MLLQISVAGVSNVTGDFSVAGVSSVIGVSVVLLASVSSVSGDFSSIVITCNTDITITHMNSLLHKPQASLQIPSGIVKIE